MFTSRLSGSRAVVAASFLAKSGAARCALLSKATTAGGASRTMRVASRPSDLVGGTPLIDLDLMLKGAGVDNGSRLFGKLESLGPCSSVKDRLGLSMINEAEK